MAAPTDTQSSGKVVISHVGLMLSGDIANPILDADTVVIEAGRITAIGRASDCDTAAADMHIDARGTALAPGLIDSHVHPVFGDWTPRQNQLGWIDSTLNGGVTTMISAGEVHLPGRPKDIVGLKALAITAQRSFSNSRPAGVKVLAGAPVLEKGMVESDFAELAAAGVTLLGEVGLGSVKSGEEAQRMVAWARRYGIQSTIHTGGPSIPGSGLIDKDVVLEADADIIGHINGGHTSLPYEQVCELCERSRRGLEIVHNGNERIGILTGAPRPRARLCGSSHSGHRWARRVRCSAPRYFAHDRFAVEHGGCPCRGGFLLRHRKYGAFAAPGFGGHRSGTGGPIWFSWTRRSIRPGVTYSIACVSEIFRALGWFSSMESFDVKEAAIPRPQHKCPWSFHEGRTMMGAVPRTMSDIRQTVANGRMGAHQITAIIVCVGLNMLDGFDVLVMSFTASGVSATWKLTGVAGGHVTECGTDRHGPGLVVPGTPRRSLRPSGHCHDFGIHRERGHAAVDGGPKLRTAGGFESPHRHRHRGHTRERHRSGQRIFVRQMAQYRQLSLYIGLFHRGHRRRCHCGHAHRALRMARRVRVRGHSVFRDAAHLPIFGFPNRWISWSHASLPAR